MEDCTEDAMDSAFCLVRYGNKYENGLPVY